jgi:hypothetical protein
MDDYHIVRIGGVPYRGVYVDPAIDGAGIQSAGVTIALIGYRTATGAARIQRPDDSETTINPGDTIAEVELYTGETRGPFTVAHVESLPSGLVRIHCRGSA